MLTTKSCESTLIDVYGVVELRKLVKMYNQIDGLNFNEEVVIKGYKIWKKRIFLGIISGELYGYYLKYKSNENKGYKLSHEIIRQFDVNPKFYTGIHQFLAIYDASYAHMASEIPCEKIGKQMKSRLNDRQRMNTNTLNNEIIISCNGPSISEMNAFILEASRIFLQSHRLPITSNTKYNTGSVVDGHHNKSSKFEW